MPLFTLATDRVRLVWSCAERRCAHPEGGCPRVRAERLDGGGEPTLDVSPGATALAEETAYRVLVEAPDGAHVSLLHDDPVVVAGVERLGAGMLHGTVRFGSAAGWSRFVVALGGRPHAAFTVEVAPSKLDFRVDFRALVADIGRIADSLVLAVVAPAFVDAEAGGDLGGGVLTRVTLLDALAGRLEAALRFAFAHPIPHAERALESVPLHRTRRAGPALERRLARGDLGVDDVRPLALPQHAHRPSDDGPEHRWLAAHLRATADDARRLAARAGRTPRGEAARAHLDALAGRIERLLMRGPLAAVAPGAAPPHPAPLRLAQAPGYREAARLVRLLRQSLSLGTGRLPARLRPLHRLYETWCYLALAEALADATGSPLPAGRLVRTSSDDRLTLRLAPRLDFDAPGGVRLTLRYAPRHDAPGALLVQRPDFVLTRTAPGARPAHAVLDAKYRLDRSPGYLARFGAPGPPETALGALHRYRDALVDEAGARPVRYAAALYPWHDDGRYPSSRLARSLAGIGVGAIPLLPGSTGALRAFVAAFVAGEAA